MGGNELTNMFARAREIETRAMRMKENINKGKEDRMLLSSRFRIFLFLRVYFQYFHSPYNEANRRTERTQLFYER